LIILLKSFLLLRVIITATLGRHLTMGKMRRGSHFPYWSMGLILKGSALLTSRGRHLRVEADWLGLWEPNSPYEVRCEAGTQEFWALLSLRSEIASTARSWPSPLPRRHHVYVGGSSEFSRIRELALESVELFTSPDPQDRLLAENAIERVLLLADSAYRKTTRRAHDARVAHALSLMETQFRKPMTLMEIARQVHVSPSRFAHLFHDEIGQSPMAYLEHIRMQEAIRLLLGTDMRIYQVGEAVGFINPYHFSVRFRKYAGQPPHRFRHTPHHNQVIGKDDSSPAN